MLKSDFAIELYNAGGQLSKPDFATERTHRTFYTEGAENHTNTGSLRTSFHGYSDHFPDR